MHNRLILLALFVIAPAPAVAQQSEQSGTKYNGSYYGLFSAGRCWHGYAQLGGALGAEALVWKGITVGAEGSYQQFRDGWGYGMFSPQFGYHFVNRNQLGRWDPFVTLGAGWVFAAGAVEGVNFGGGVTYWLKPRVGIRIEYRTHAAAFEEVVGAFRVGVTIR